MMRRGLHTTVEYLVTNWYIPNEINILENIRSENGQINAKFDKTLKLSMGLQSKKLLTPVFKWG